MSGVGVSVGDSIADGARVGVAADAGSGGGVAVVVVVDAAGCGGVGCDGDDDAAPNRKRWLQCPSS